MYIKGDILLSNTKCTNAIYFSTILDDLWFINLIDSLEEFFFYIFKENWFSSVPQYLDMISQINIVSIHSLWEIWN